MDDVNQKIFTTVQTYIVFISAHAEGELSCLNEL
jgi:hypothetical protein